MGITWLGAAGLWSALLFALLIPVGAQAQEGRGCSVFKPCPRGYTCEAFVHKCRGPGREGDSCHATRPCGPGLRCEAGSQKCRGPGREGDSCHATRPCGPGLTCEAGSHKCRGPGRAGDACHATRPCGQGLSCQPGVQKCYHTPRREGEPCSAGYGCGSGLTCEAGSQTCRRPGGEGDSCHATRPCGAGLTCEAGSHKCRRPGNVGDPCHLTRPCGSGLSCQPGVHRCYHTPRQVCEPCVAGHGCAPGLTCQAGSQVCRGPQDYQIEIVWAPSPSGVKQPTAKVKERMRAAVDRWRGVIAGHLPQIRYQVPAGHSYHADDAWIAAKAPGGSAWNDLRIVVRINKQSAFGGDNVLAHARPVIHDGNGMPRLGMVEISEAKMDSNIAGYTEAVLVHEIGHILGFNAGMFGRKNLLSGDRKKFTGAKAVAAWRAMGKGGQPPLQYDPNDSTLQPGGHWDESTLNTELMTPSTDTFMDIWSTMKLSRLSTGALQDMGYRVVECEGGEGIASGPGGATRAQGSKCADEGGQCRFAGAGRVYYGARDKWAVKDATGGIACNNGVFGDPLRGVRKACFVESVGGGGGGG
ncbi:MAG: hypothetical protein H6702_14525, partial [Myxococcales bacterium]|nr:hypothetical protein [Myxococcales bacterium]